MRTNKSYKKRTEAYLKIKKWKIVKWNWHQAQLGID
jgi:hypothetical protein